MRERKRKVDRFEVNGVSEGFEHINGSIICLHSSFQKKIYIYIFHIRENNWFRVPSRFLYKSVFKIIKLGAPTAVLIAFDVESIKQEILINMRIPRTQ